mmetsp:Transcript_78733/g.155934  ORF Transcript_78733/g.155934 Transcript_78733/m.155934 type:complete len:95 (-) Transcript_78733:141-425(-)
MFASRMSPLASSLRVPQDKDHRVASQEELADETVLVDWLGLLLATVRDLSPHLSDVLKDHVGVTVKSFDTCKDLSVVPAIDEHLGIVLDTLLQH